MSAFAYLQKDYDKIQQKKKLETDLVKNLNKPNSNKKRKREDHVDDTTENEADDEMVKMVKRLKKTKKRFGSQKEIEHEKGQRNTADKEENAFGTEKAFDSHENKTFQV